MMQRVATKVETVAQDAMSKRETLVITIPQYGSEGLAEALALIRSMARSHANTLGAAKKVIADGPGVDADPLSKGAYFERASRAIAEAEMQIAAIPAGYREVATSALNHAFAAGALMKEALIRQAYLPDVAREATMKVARQNGGKARSRKLGPQTEEVLRFMARQVALGKRPTEAAKNAFHRSQKDGGPLGTSEKANRRLYYAHLGPNASAEHTMSHGKL